MTSNRLGIDQLFMSMAHLMAERGTCTRAKVGAIVVRDRRIISTGYVGSPPGEVHCIDVGCSVGPDGGCLRTIHAEANAIGYAARHGVSLEGAMLYTTVSPCLTCAKLILAAGIGSVVSHANYRDTQPFELLRGKVALIGYDDSKPWEHLYILDPSTTSGLCLICAKDRMWHTG